MSDAPSHSDAQLRRAGLLFLLAATLLVFIVRLTAPHNIMASDQQRPAAYILDVLRNGHWVVQTDWKGDITSKPPMYTWLAALASSVSGRLTTFTLYLPCGLATAGVVIIVYMLAGHLAGWQAALLSGVLYLCSPLATKQIALARTDAVFSFFVALGACVAYRCWRRGGGWTLFWLVAALATLTKGPFGVLLSAAGLLAALWEWRTHGPAPVKGSHLVGGALYLLLVLGWFLWALHDMGQPVYDKLIGRELLSHTVASHDGKPFLGRLWRPTFYFFTRFAPASLLAVAGVRRVLVQPAESDAGRQLERFLCCWLLTGLSVLSLVSHQRGDLLMPVIAPAAVLAGRELALLARLVTPRRTFAVASAVFLISLAALVLNDRWLERSDKRIRRTAGMRELAHEIAATKPAAAAILYVDTPFAIQFYLNTMNLRTLPAEAAVRLVSDRPVWVAFHNPKWLASCFGGVLPPFQVAARWPAQGDPFVTIIANKAALQQQRKPTGANIQP